jgi:hypothetical protein
MMVCQRECEALRKRTLDFAITVDFEVWRFWLQSEHCLCLILVRSSHLISHAIWNTNRETVQHYGLV